MKKSILFLFFALIAFGVNAQRMVLLEEFTGAKDSLSPMGAHYVDSMAALYPNLIPVCLHSFSPSDSMDFAAADTIGLAYANAYPAAAIDRISHTGVVGLPDTQWKPNIQQRLAAATKLDVMLDGTWDSITRDIAAHVQVSITSNIDTGDYRISLYIVEDSVTGTGTGYAQRNAFNTTVGNPFFGKGDPITGFMHRHVARALLPSPWGLAGVLTSAPAVGQNYAHIFHYTLPVSYDENKITMVAFVSAFSPAHVDDSVLNAAVQKLEIHPVTKVTNVKTGSFSIYPNPAQNTMAFSSGDSKIYTLYLYNTLGQLVIKKDFQGTATIAKSELDHSGIYFSRIMQGKDQVLAKTIMFQD